MFLSQAPILLLLISADFFFFSADFFFNLTYKSEFYNTAEF